MPNPENLKPCKPGETHNPNGRPKGRRSLTTILRELLETEMKVKDPITGESSKRSGAEILMLRMFKDAANGNTRAQQLIMERMEGKTPISIEVKKEPHSKEEVISALNAIAQKEGITLEQLCEKEGIDIERI